MDNSQNDVSKLNYVWAISTDMQVSEVQKTLLHLVSKCSLALGEGFDNCKRILISKKDEASRHFFLLRTLLDSCHLTSESVLILIGNNKIWDADILTRAVFEGTIKFVFLSYGSPEEVNQKITEYYEILPQIARLKRHHRLSILLEAQENPQADEWKPFRDLLLSKVEREAIASRYPRKMRQCLEEKWSFHRLLRALDDSNIQELRYSSHLFYNYGMSSHILHQDADGVGMILDRNNRSEERKNAVELAHASRILNDMMSMNLMRHVMSLRFVENPIRPSLEIYEKYNDLINELHENVDKWLKMEYGADAKNTSNE